MRTIHRALIAIAVSAIAVSTATAQASVILVRHAEKATVGGNDPSLSDIGQARAKALAATLADANVTAIITTTLKRTIETGQILATARNLEIEKIAVEGG